MSPEKFPFTRAKPPTATTRGIVADSISKSVQEVSQWTQKELSVNPGHPPTSSLDS